MLRGLDPFTLGGGEPTAQEVELMARVIAESFADRPSILEPIPATGPRLNVGEADEYARKRVERIREKLEKPSQELQESPTKEAVSETTHLSVMDAEGNAVALTTSIGPVFGDGVASEELGFLYAHSYRLDTRPLPHQRDYTEMTPTIVLRHGRPVMVVGAAGGVRIPGAILQVLSNVIDRGYSLEEAVAAPRVFCRRNELQLHEDFPLAVLEWLRGRGFKMEIIARDGERHLGRVHAIRYDPESGEFVGVAEPAYDGTAAGPQ
jgi:gamma-glutamyltranspeptidase/glutathione hydrolase